MRRVTALIGAWHACIAGTVWLPALGHAAHLFERLPVTEQGPLGAHSHCGELSGRARLPPTSLDLLLQAAHKITVPMEPVNIPAFMEVVSMGYHMLWAARGPCCPSCGAYLTAA
jgi:hypothetical protein